MSLHEISADEIKFPAPVPQAKKNLEYDKYYETSNYQQEIKDLKASGYDVLPSVTEMLKYLLRDIDLPDDRQETPISTSKFTAWIDKQGLLKLEYYLNERDWWVLSKIIIQQGSNVDYNNRYDRAKRSVEHMR